MELTDLTTVAGRLADATNKLHLLLTGALPSVVIVDSGGYTVHYSRANVPLLKAYIAELTAEMNGCKTVGAINIVYYR